MKMVNSNNKIIIMIVVRFYSPSRLMSFVSTVRHCYFSASSVTPSLYSRLTPPTLSQKLQAISYAKVIYLNYIC